MTIRQISIHRCYQDTNKSFQSVIGQCNYKKKISHFDYINHTRGVPTSYNLIFVSVLFLLRKSQFFNRVNRSRNVVMLSLVLSWHFPPGVRIRWTIHFSEYSVRSRSLLTKYWKIISWNSFFSCHKLLLDTNIKYLKYGVSALILFEKKTKYKCHYNTETLCQYHIFFEMCSWLMQ